MGSAAVSPSFSQHRSLVHPVAAQTVVPAEFTRLYLLGHVKFEQNTSGGSDQTTVTCKRDMVRGGRTVALAEHEHSPQIGYFHSSTAISSVYSYYDSFLQILPKI